MISPKMEKALNDQIHEELYSSYLYLAMAQYCLEEKLGGFASWLTIQSKEEYGHAMKLIGYLHDQNARVQLQALKAPPIKWKSPQAAFAEVMKHEQHITACINKLVDQAIELKDHATRSFLTWFVQEQVEEEGSVMAVLDMVELTAKMPAGLFMVDREMAKRTAG
jgi:ferritin